MVTHWPDMQRVAASLAMGTVRAYDLLRMLGRDGSPTPLGHALADYGKLAKTLHLLAMCDPPGGLRLAPGVRFEQRALQSCLARRKCLSGGSCPDLPQTPSPANRDSAAWPA